MSTETCMTGRCGHVGRWGRKLRQEVGDVREQVGVDIYDWNSWWESCRMAHCAVPNGVAD